MRSLLFIESLRCMVNIEHTPAVEVFFYPVGYAEWASVEQSRTRLISPQAMAAQPEVGGWWISVPGYIMVVQGRMRVKDNTLPSLLNQMQIKLKAAEQQIPPVTGSLQTPHKPLSLCLALFLPPPPFIPLRFLLIVWAGELRKQTGGGDGCSQAFTTKII